MKKRLAAVMLFALLCLMCGCARVSNPLMRAETTALPGLPMELHAATASDSGAYEVSVALYYRFLDEPMLAAEYRTLEVRRDESAELATINALLAGPSASGVELTRLIPEGVRVEDVASENGILFVTLNDALLSDGVPEDWLTIPEWREEAPTLRRLTIQSLVATITESFPHSSVQIMVRQSGGAKQSLRLDNSYFLGELTGPGEPQLRDEACLLTPHNTASAILTAYKARDFGSLYKYTAVRGADALKPGYDDFAALLSDYPALTEFAVSPGNMSLSGVNALITVDMTFLTGGERAKVHAYPLPLIRENGIWKISCESLLALIDAAGRSGI